MTDTVAQAIFGIGCPFAIGGFVAALGAQATDERGRARFTWRLALAAGLPVTLAFIGLFGQPADAWHKLLYVPAVGIAIAVLAAFAPRRALVRLGLLLALTAATMACAWPVLRPETNGLKAATAGAVFVVTLVLEGLLQRRPGAGPIIAIGLALTASSALVLASGFLTLAVAYGALAVAVTAIGVVGGLRNRSLAAHGGLAAVVGPMLVLGPLTGWLYTKDGGAGLPLAYLALPTIAPLAMWLVEPFPRRLREGWFGLIARLAIVMLVCGAAGTLAIVGAGDEAAEDDPYADMYKDMMG
ncbi:MAG: hypothetical protein ACYTGR_03255 [Planctomycetota bacterium]|jgi:hypothetical protein